MAKQKKIDRGLYRIENKDGSVSWIIDYLNPDKKRIRKTYGTKKQAQEELNKRRALMADGEYSVFVEKRKARTKTFGELVKLYRDTYKEQASYKTAKRFFVDKFKDHFGKDTLLSEIGYYEIKLYRKAVKRAGSKKRKGHVFLFKDQPIKDVKVALKAACERAGIPYGRNTPNGITFHDLRHSFGSLLQQTQRDIRITQQLMNHKSIQMTERYTHSRSEAKIDAVNSIDWNLHNEKSPMSANVS